MNVSGLDFTQTNHGAGIQAILDDGTDVADIQVRDGADSGFINFPDPSKTTVEQIFNFAPAGVDRNADLAFFAGSVSDPVTEGVPRPNAIKVTVGANTPILFVDELGSLDGEEWDILLRSVNIPAGVRTVAVQVLSEGINGIGDLPASLVWVGGTLALTTIPECTGVIGDLVWMDSPDCDGIQSGEPGLAGFHVFTSGTGRHLHCDGSYKRRRALSF